MTQRYIVRSATGHQCCYDAEVIDQLTDELICECPLWEIAEKIANLLNLAASTGIPVRFVD